MAILVALVLTLTGILRQFVAGPAEGLRPEVSTGAEGESAAKPTFPEAVLYPPVPAVLPDLNDGYLFNSERKFEAVAVDTAGGGNGAVDLDEVTYAGSLIVGEIYKALITYQEKSPVARSPASTARQAARTRRAAPKVVSKYKQLEQGAMFMGYLVEKIEKDRIVFSKGDEVVEKFLYDPDKDRTVPGSAAKSPGKAAATRAEPRTPVQRTVSPPARNVSPATAVANARRVVPESGHDTGQPAAAELIKSRSERLLGLDPSLGRLRSPGLPGDPLRR